MLAYWLRLFSSQTFSRINTPTFSNLVILHTYPPMKMEECSETSAYKIQTPANNPEESIQQGLLCIIYYGSKWLKIWTGQELLITVPWKSLFSEKNAYHPCCRLGKEKRLPVPIMEFSFFDRPADRPVNVLSGSHHVTLRLNIWQVILRAKFQSA